jgi:hypothetical protein
MTLPVRQRLVAGIGWCALQFSHCLIPWTFLAAVSDDAKQSRREKNHRNCRAALGDRDCMHRPSGIGSDVEDETTSRTSRMNDPLIGCASIAPTHLPRA